MLDSLVHRVMGGVRISDHLGGDVLRDGIEIQSSTLQFSPTASGIWAIRVAPGFAAYARSWETVPTVSAQEFAFEVHDRRGMFWPVAATISLPRNLGPDADEPRVDTPVEIVLPSSPRRAEFAGWSVITASVTDQTGAPVQGALVEAMPEGGGADALGWGMTGPNGMALLPHWL